MYSTEKTKQKKMKNQDQKHLQTVHVFKALVIIETHIL